MLQSSSVTLRSGCYVVLVFFGLTTGDDECQGPERMLFVTKIHEIDGTLSWPEGLAVDVAASIYQFLVSESVSIILRLNGNSKLWAL